MLICINAPLCHFCFISYQLSRHVNVDRNSFWSLCMWVCDVWPPPTTHTHTSALCTPEPFGSTPASAESPSFLWWETDDTEHTHGHADLTRVNKPSSALQRHEWGALLEHHLRYEVDLFPHVEPLFEKELISVFAGAFLKMTHLVYWNNKTPVLNSFLCGWRVIEGFRSLWCCHCWHCFTL